MQGKNREELLGIAQSMPFRELPDSYTVTGIQYNKVQQGRKAVIYSSEHSCEVFKLRVAKPTVVKDVPVPERYKVPGNEDFGGWAWCISNRGKAMEKFFEIEETDDVNN